MGDTVEVMSADKARQLPIFPLSAAWSCSVAAGDGGCTARKFCIIHAFRSHRMFKPGDGLNDLSADRSLPLCGTVLDPSPAVGCFYSQPGKTNKYPIPNKNHPAFAG